ncbi:hypothetical protein GGR58DRAFT_516246 [Xylaria digitata]|nr:hypothetical protein GGR58DRAFT_516246 [Xylaria digitata]
MNRHNVPNLPEEIWSYVLEDRIQKLRPEDQNRLRTMLNYNTFHQSLSNLLARYEAKRPLKFQRFLKPLVEGLLEFSHAFNSIFQASPFDSLGWGATQLLLESAQHSYKVLTHITDHLEDFTRTLPQCSDYVALFPHHPRLRAALQDICKIYVGICIDAACYLGKRPTVNLLLVYLKGGPVERGFNDAKVRVENCKLVFESEVNFAHIETASRIHKQITNATISRAEVSKVKTLPFGCNSSFICRHEILKPQPESGCGTRSCTIHGMGGVGKTQTALEFRYRLSKPDCCIFWLRAETPVELADTFSRIARALNLAKDSEIQDQSQLITLAQQGLSKHKDWLLIFDNVIDFDSIKSYWPVYPHGSVIVTTQNQQVKHCSTFSIHLTPMTKEDGARLLLKYLDHKGEESGIEVEGLPIAIAHVAGYVGQLGRPLSYFPEQFKERKQASVVWSMDFRSSMTQQYDHTLDTVWDFAFSALGSKSRSLLDVMAMLNPDSIPEHILLDNTDDDKMQFDQMHIELLSRHLMRPQGDTSGSALTMHRSLQKNLLFRLDKKPNVRQTVFENAIKLVKKRFPKQSPIGVPINHRWTLYELYIPHVLALHRIYIERQQELRVSANFAYLLCDEGYYMWDRHLGWEGLRILETAEEIWQTEGNRHLRRLRAKYWSRHRLRRAIRLFDDILVLRQKHNAELPLPHSQDHQLLLSNAWNDKGWMCLESENYFAAEDCFEKSLAIKRQWLEKDIPFEFAETLKNLSFVRLAQKRSKVALELLSHALQLIGEDKESGSVTIQKFRLSMAEVLFNAGQVKEALGLAFKAENLLRESLHNDTYNPYPEECRARCHYALSEVLMELGQVKKAEAHRCEAFNLLHKWRDLIMIEVSKETHDSVLFDHIVPLNVRD